ncbi:hypothetical protein DFJ58DRAFT_846896 [Suillus subalutaceus]|uniref:uncharacterized protein n=1 Tax=Suillus subalutaceus TaxID=48586 RepID=UPI001B85E6BC|nr:uncharacterized protein DFJ58DRAFT_846896 [Suillus subalutaceus]KAG1836589.1 hypothetical protein DFJ58DRAFT_846896 [Suillus subalutaceus]
MAFQEPLIGKAQQLGRLDGILAPIYGITNAQKATIGQRLSVMPSSLPDRSLFPLDMTEHPRTKLNNELQKRYGPSALEHVTWEVYSQGPPNALTWNATVYSKLMISIMVALKPALEVVLKTKLRKWHIIT